ncbi:histidine phosphatase family protein [Paenibacillus silvae]|uniref:histidine phosphatase family protein n=1 Tax=Paenibacillus silvae TaxID=1325358 RepID=UPI002006402A|nr:histidine phosphatase family protein [Paenibacillus silvae]MCK6077157.1 histidine phosphatase family protein [Paenibacillus silvae]MCK6151354.1 histidine phosphatase family protein [Paenibacillus silvae]MCK6269843.1 histidine phosphatase family protein [Paenibacillus silvae]
MTEIALIRHGSTAWNKEKRSQGQTDNPLDQEGREQAVLLAARLAEEQWDAIYASDLQRASETARIIGERLGIQEIHLDPRLREMGGGQVEGTTEEERIAKWGSDWSALDLGKEHPDAGAARGTEMLEDILRHHPNARVIVVSHGAVLRNTLRALVPEQDISVKLDNTSITRMVHRDQTWQCELYNCSTHLEQGEGNL